MRHWDQIPRESIETVKGEFINALKITHCLRGSVDGQGSKFVRKAPKIIEPHNVIGVGMGEDNCIQTPDVFAQGLGAKIRSGIDDESGLRCFDVNGRTETFVARVG